MGLPADQVGAGLDADEGDLGGAVPVDQALETADVEIALEREGAADLLSGTGISSTEPPFRTMCALLVVKW